MKVEGAEGERGRKEWLHFGGPRVPDSHNPKCRGVEVESVVCGLDVEIATTQLQWFPTERRTHSTCDKRSQLAFSRPAERARCVPQRPKRTRMADHSPFLSMERRDSESSMMVILTVP